MADIVATLPGAIVGAYWPFRQEINLLPFLEQLLANGHSIALPVVVASDRPLEFRAWTPQSAMTRGVYDIPYPADVCRIHPDILVVPVLGYDPSCFRLGYGGGFYDRTLASFTRRVLTIGIGFEMAKLETIYPQPYDIPMDLIVTDRGITQRQA